MDNLFRIANFRRTYLYLKKNGIPAAFYAVIERLHKNGYEDYEVKGLSRQERRRQKDMGFAYKPRISILVPAYETGEAHLREMIESVLKQTYGRLELIIADAGRTDGVGRIVREIQGKDGRVVYIRLDENRGISENTNAALRTATGEYIGLLDHDDVLTEDALFEVVQALNAARGQGITPGMLYSDEDKGDGELERFYEPHFKPGFNLDLLLSNNYICHFLVLEAELMKGLGFRKEYDGAQDYDLILRAAGTLREEQIIHIPKVLYHWRCHGGSTAENPASKSYAYEAGKRAVEDFAACRGWRAAVSHTGHLGFYRVAYPAPGGVLDERPDVAAVGGRLLRHGKIAGGAYMEDGTALYRGLSKHFSGYMHRAVLCQDVAAVDVRCMRVRPEYEQDYRRLFQRAVSESGREGDMAYVRASLELCAGMREKGYRVLWDPGMEKTV